MEKQSPTNQEQAQPTNRELLEKINTYFHLLNKPDAGLSQEEAEVVAGEYFKEQIAGKYPSYQINTCLWMSR